MGCWVWVTVCLDSFIVEVRQDEDIKEDLFGFIGLCHTTQSVVVSRDFPTSSQLHRNFEGFAASPGWFMRQRAPSAQVWGLKIESVRAAGVSFWLELHPCCQLILWGTCPAVQSQTAVPFITSCIMCSSQVSLITHIYTAVSFENLVWMSKLQSSPQSFRGSSLRTPSPDIFSEALIRRSQFLADASNMLM